MDKLPKRKCNRLTGFNYSSNGTYFITICTQDRKCVLSSIVGQGLAPAETKLSKYGQIAEEQLLLLESRYQMIEINKYVIMPNHIHIIISLNNNSAGASPCPTISAIICAYKSLTTISCKKVGFSNQKLFQNSFYDHIIRDEDDYLTKARYIEENPAKWSEDKYYES